MSIHTYCIECLNRRGISVPPNKICMGGCNLCSTSRDGSAKEVAEIRGYTDGEGKLQIALV